MAIKNQKGSLSLAMSLALFIILGTSIGLWSVLHRWKGLMETQLRLDRCTGETAHQLRDTLNSIESSNTQIKLIRAAIVAATLFPPAEPAVPALEIALKAEVAYQEFLRGRWLFTQGRWDLHFLCGNLRDFPTPLPSLEWVRDPPDFIGEKALNWKGEMPKEFNLKILNYPRLASARVYRPTPKKEKLIGNQEWLTQWQ